MRVQHVRPRSCTGHNARATQASGSQAVAARPGATGHRTSARRWLQSSSPEAATKGLPGAVLEPPRPASCLHYQQTQVSYRAYQGFNLMSCYFHYTSGASLTSQNFSLPCHRNDSSAAKPLNFRSWSYALGTRTLPDEVGLEVLGWRRTLHAKLTPVLSGS